jgi:hypothetical protein
MDVVDELNPAMMPMENFEDGELDQYLPMHTRASCRVAQPPPPPYAAADPSWMTSHRLTTSTTSSSEATSSESSPPKDASTGFSSYLDTAEAYRSKMDARMQQYKNSSTSSYAQQYYSTADEDYHLQQQQTLYYPSPYMRVYHQPAVQDPSAACSVQAQWKHPQI